MPSFIKNKLKDLQPDHPLLATAFEKEQKKWPYLEELLAKGEISYLEYRLVDCLCESREVEEEAALFICHLVRAAKEGHLCVHAGEEIFPTVEELWLVPENLAKVKQSILSGIQKLPGELITVDPGHLPSTHLCKYKNLYYLQKNWFYETTFWENFLQHLSIPPELQIDLTLYEKLVMQMEKEGELLREQAEGLLAAAASSFSIISGGPGTGKTYTAGRLLQVFWQSLSTEQRKNCTFALAAPTGKAAANLQKSLGDVIGNLDGCPSFQVKTLHALLGIKPSYSILSDPPLLLAADFILIDESSMLDVRMMALLFQAVQRGARLVLLGDSHQLPSVEAGSLFADLIRLSFRLSYPCTHLRTCLRAELKSIVSFAGLVNQGNGDAVLNYSQEGIALRKLPEGRHQAEKELLHHVLPLFPSLLDYEPPPLEVLLQLNAVRLLSPLRKGVFGVEEINQLIWQSLSCQKKSGWLPVPIMITTNDYAQDLFNGETGVLMYNFPSLEKNYALFPSRNGGYRHFSAYLLPSYEYAYCMSVHKSQGSEFDRVIVLLPDGSELFGREVLYTAVTRARKQVEIYGSDATITKILSKKGGRLSGLEERLLNNSSMA